MKKLTTLTTLTAVATIVMITTSQAAMTVFTEDFVGASTPTDYDDSVIPSGNFTTAAGNLWTATNSTANALFMDNNGSILAASGIAMLTGNEADASGITAALASTISLAANTQYTVSWETIANVSTGFSVDLSISGVFTGSDAGTAPTNLVASNGVANGPATTDTFVFTTGAAQSGNATFTFTANDNGQSSFSRDIWLAGASIDAVAVPEPSSSALLGLGGLALLLRRRK